MKKVLLAISILLTTIISGYYIFVWNPKTVATEANVEERKDVTLKSDSKIGSNNEEKKNEEIIRTPNKSIAESMVSEDVNKISQYIGKLSIIDSALIEEYMNKKNDSSSVKEMVRIFKSRFTNEEYKDIKMILNKYIDVNVIEKGIL